MAQKSNPNLKLVEPLNGETIRKRAPDERVKRVSGAAAFIGCLVLAIFGTFLLLENHSYQTIYHATQYEHETSDSNWYAAFGNGIIRYSRDGVTYLNYRNEEKWIQSAQFTDPILESCEDSFAVGDLGGNAIQVFTKDGLKGEIETTLPIEKISVSGQGIVSAILKNETDPFIVTYDASGNILVENQVQVSSSGYPIALDMSPDGTILMASYLDTAGGNIRSRVIFYQFGEAGQEDENHEVVEDEYENEIFPEVFFMDSDTSVAVGDSSFVIYEGSDEPQKQTEISLDTQIRSTFHSKRYLGFVTLNEDQSGYEIRLYNKSGKWVMSQDLSREYSNVQMVDDEIFLYEGTNCCIVRTNGVQRYKGDLEMEAAAVIPLRGLNRYMVINADESRVIYLLE